jgi:hypothetical protein
MDPIHIAVVPADVTAVAAPSLLLLLLCIAVLKIAD